MSLLVLPFSTFFHFGSHLVMGILNIKTFDFKQLLTTLLATIGADIMRPMSLQGLGKMRVVEASSLHPYHSLYHFLALS